MREDGSTPSGQIALEQVHLDETYRRLDEIRDHVQYRLDRAIGDPIAGTPGSLTERDAMVAGYVGRMQELNGVDDRLCFGRLDMLDGARRYVGRIGISDDDQVPLLMDWRADAAAAFYRATAAAPAGVVRRRHIATSNREVTGLDDDVLMIDALTESELETVTGNDSLLTALDSARTGQMRDIVATIQAEQDEIIRSDSNGVLVVEGGPGTGKTVVALHRVAYLLYSEQARIARSGALVIGPNRDFLRYIDNVLPALGETGVVLKTLDSLFGEVSVDGQETEEVARIKARLDMVDVIAQAVRDQQRIPAKDIHLRIDGSGVRLSRYDIEKAAKRARDTGMPHNAARNVFAKDLLRRLARHYAQALRMGTDDETVDGLIPDLRENRDVRREINLCWLPLTPEQLVGRLLADPSRLESAAPGLSSEQRSQLLRPLDSPWTSGDVPLLDEAAELLGEWAPINPGGANEQREHARQLAYARDALAASGVAASMITADEYAKRFMQHDSRASVAERADADRSWTYGHLVVDEAQELTPMQWRMVMRRCPTRSMTIVGDPAQAASPGAVANWQAALSPYVEDRWRHQQLRINYRTPLRIMQAATELMEACDLPGTPPTAVREGRWQIELVETETPTLTLQHQIEREIATLDTGTIGVIAPDSLEAQASTVAELGALKAPNARVTVRVSTVRDAKGLEFDSVILFEPQRTFNQSSSGASDLYVAMTRPTQRLVLVHSEPLPPVLRDSIVRSLP